jgi:hypothetical protein
MLKNFIFTFVLGVLAVAAHAQCRIVEFPIVRDSFELKPVYRVDKQGIETYKTLYRIQILAQREAPEQLPDGTEAIYDALTDIWHVYVVGEFAEDESLVVADLWAKTHCGTFRVPLRRFQPSIKTVILP